MVVLYSVDFLSAGVVLFSLSVDFFGVVEVSFLSVDFPEFISCQSSVLEPSCRSSPYSAHR